MSLPRVRPTRVTRIVGGLVQPTGVLAGEHNQPGDHPEGGAKVPLRPHEVEVLHDVAAYGRTHGASEKLVYADATGKVSAPAVGTEGANNKASVDPTPAMTAEAASYDKLTIIHNHPGDLAFSVADMKEFAEHDNFERGHVVTSDGTVHSVVKPAGATWDRRKARDLDSTLADLKYDEHDNLRHASLSKSERYNKLMEEALTSMGLVYATQPLPAKP